MSYSISIKCKTEKQLDKFVNLLNELPKMAGRYILKTNDNLSYRPTKGTNFVGFDYNCNSYGRYFIFSIMKILQDKFKLNVYYDHKKYSFEDDPFSYESFWEYDEIAHLESVLAEFKQKL